MELTLTLPPFIVASAAGVVVSLVVLVVTALILSLIASAGGERLGGLLGLICVGEFFVTPRWVVCLVATLVTAGIASAVAVPATAILATVIVSGVATLVASLTILLR